MTLPSAPPDVRSQPVILIIEDDPVIRDALRQVLQGLDASVLDATGGRDAVKIVADSAIDLVVLDLGLPDIDGLTVCRTIRATSSVPILVVSARESESVKVALLDAGADDYLTKPFGSAEFAARVRAQLRRVRPVEGTTDGRLRLGTLELDLAERVATRDGASVHLTPIEWGLLRALARSAGRTLTHRALFDAVWGREYGDAAQYLRVHVTNLRRKVEIDSSRPVFIVTEPGVGYRLELTR